MKSVCFVFALASVVLTPNTSWSDNVVMSGKALPGVGFVQCENFLRLKNENADLSIFYQWYLGFWASENIRRALDGETIKNLSTPDTSQSVLVPYFAEVCSRETEQTLFNAMSGFFEELPDLE